MAKESGHSKSIKGSGTPTRIADGNIRMGEIQTAASGSMGPEDFSEGYPNKKTSILSNTNVKLGRKGG